jgi:hypothetical protein
VHRENGFYQGASGKVVDMLLWRDLNAPAMNETTPMPMIESG